MNTIFKIAVIVVLVGCVLSQGTTSQAMTTGPEAQNTTVVGAGGAGGAGAGVNVQSTTHFMMHNTTSLFKTSSGPGVH